MQDEEQRETKDHHQTPTPSSHSEKYEAKSDKDLHREESKEPQREESEDEKVSFFEKTLGMGWTLGSLVKKTLKGSLNSLFMSEDGLAQSLSEMALPKELAAFIMQYAESSKKEFTRILSKEVKSFLESADFYNELRKFLSTMELDVQAKITFKERVQNTEQSPGTLSEINPTIDDIHINLQKNKEPNSQ